MNAGAARLSRAGALAGLLWSLSAPAAPPAPVVVLVESGASMYQQAAQGFRKGFPSQQFDLVALNGNPRDIRSTLGRLRGTPYKLIVAIGTEAARAAREQLPGAPLLYCLALNPGQNNLLGQDIGGVALEVNLEQQWAQIRKTLPQIRSIGVVYEETASGAKIRRAQRLLKGEVRLVAEHAGTPQEAARKIQQIQDRVDAFWLLWDRTVLNPANFRLLVEVSMKSKVALIAPAPPFVEAGALMSVGANYEKAGHRAGEMAREILNNGARAGQFTEPPPETVLTINGQVARRVGVAIPRDLPADVVSPP